MAIDWSRGYSAVWRMSSVVKETWADGPALGRVTSVAVKRDITGDAPLIETADVRVDMDAPDGFTPGWYRVEMIAIQDGASELAAVFTGLFEQSGWDYADGVYDVSLAGRSVLQPIKDSILPTGSYTPQGADGAEEAADMIADRTPAPVEAAGSFIVGTTVVHDVGSTALEAVWSVLSNDGWTIGTDGMGDATVKPEPTVPVRAFSAGDIMIASSGLTQERDVSDVPNRFRAVDQDAGEEAEAVNDDASSETSYAVRGRWVDALEESPTLRDGETLERYAERRLEELSTVKAELQYFRKYEPGIEVGDLVDLPQGIGRIVQQDYQCGNGIIVNETVQIEEVLWNAA